MKSICVTKDAVRIIAIIVIIDCGKFQHLNLNMINTAVGKGNFDKKVKLKLK